MAAILAVGVVLMSVTPSPYIVLRPGPTVDVLSDVSDTEVIGVDSDTHDSDGALRLVTVSLVGTPENRTSWLTAAQAFLDPTQQVIPLEQEFAGDRTAADRTEANAVLMDRSQEQAAAAAFNALGENVLSTLTVSEVVEDGPSVGVLETGDVIVEVRGKPVVDFPRMQETIAATQPGQEIEVLVERDGELVALRLAPQVPLGGGSPMIGVMLDIEYELPYEVEFALSDIGGPSAGIVFALALYELLTPGSLIAGLDVSGTGTVDSAGNVGPIDGLQQKLWGADRDGSDVFLMPLENCEMLPDRRPDGLEIVPVATLDEAIEAIETLSAGGTPPGVERCAAQE